MLKVGRSDDAANLECFERGAGANYRETPNKNPCLRQGFLLAGAA